MTVRRGDIRTRRDCGGGTLYDIGVYCINAARNLFRAEPTGRRWAMVRRLGVMYIIYNRRIWASYRAEEGWRPYVGANPHTDHIHFSFSWAGARKQTSYWDGTPVTGSRTGRP